MKYDLHNSLVDSELERVDTLLKEAKYDDAQNVLRFIETNFGASGKLYIKKAKYHTCILQFDVALEEYKEANKSYILHIGKGEDPICILHISKIKKILSGKFTENDFLKYAKSLTSNENYSIPEGIHYLFKPPIKEKLTLKAVLILIVCFIVFIFLILLFIFPSKFLIRP